MSNEQNIPSQNRQGRQRTTSAQKEILIRLALVEGNTIREAAQVANVNESTARNIVAAYRREGAIIEHPCGGNNRVKLTPEVLECIEEAIERCPVATLNQIKQRLEENQVVLSKSTVFNGLEKLKITLKNLFPCKKYCRK